MRSGCCARSSGVERDAHGHALHDLDPVAGRVLRRQQRERGAGTGGHADARWPWNITARRRGRSRTSAGWPMRRSRSWPSLKFASTHRSCNGITVISAWPGCDVLAELHAALGDVARHRRDDRVALRGDPRVAVRRLRDAARRDSPRTSVPSTSACAALRWRCACVSASRASSTVSSAWRNSSGAIACRASSGSRRSRSRLARARAPTCASRTAASYWSAVRLLLANLPHRLRERARGPAQTGSASAGSSRTSTWPALTSCVSSASDGDDGAGHLRRDHDLVAGDVGVVGPFALRQHEVPEQHPDQADPDECERDQGHDFASLAVRRRRGCGFGGGVHGVGFVEFEWISATRCGLP